jgi:hypothetical protein
MATDVDAQAETQSCRQFPSVGDKPPDRDLPRAGKRAVDFRSSSSKPNSGAVAHTSMIRSIEQTRSRLGMD